MSQGSTVAFALGGIAGSNAHGIGFLQAAGELGLRPDILSCTSGMIHWVWRWLEEADLAAEVAASSAQAPFRGMFWPLNWWILAQRGVEEMMIQPAWSDYMRRLFRLPAPMTPEDVMERVFPANADPTARPATDFAAVARIFNAQSFPILFNSFDLLEGREYLHANPAGRDLLARQEARGARFGPRDVVTEARRSGIRPRVMAAEITPEAVRDALWLTGYGFDDPDRRQTDERRIDGAYVRQFILDELADADLVLVPRPEALRRGAAPPQDYFEVKDLETELWFNGLYAQQVARIELVNRLVRAAVLPSPPFREVDLVPIGVAVGRGYFSRFYEDPAVFRGAAAESRPVLEEALARHGR